MKNIILTLILSIVTFSIKAQIPPRPSPFTQSKTVVCQGETGVVYSVPVVVGATSYVWSFTPNFGPYGITINGSDAATVEVTSANGGNSVLLNFGITSQSGTLSVASKNGSGTSGTRILAVTVNLMPSAPIIGGNLIVESGNLTILTASGCAGQINWYNSATISPANLVAANTTTFVTPILYENTFYYLNCTSASSCTGPALKTMVHVVPGKYDWAKNSTRPPAEPSGRVTYSEGKKMKIDANGNIFIAGKVQNSFDYTHNGVTTTIVAQNHPDPESWQDCYVMKIASDGTFLWAKTFGMTGSEDAIVDMDVTTTGQLYVSSLHGKSGSEGGNPVNFKYDGTLYSAIHHRGGAVLKISAANGTLNWVKNLNNYNEFINGWYSGEVELNSTRLFSIDHQSPSNQDFGQPNIFAALRSDLDTDPDLVIDASNKIWSLGGGFFAPNINTLRKFKQLLLINGGNSMIVTGHYGVNYESVFLSRIDNINTAMPTLAWVKTPNITTFGGDPFKITVDNSNNIYVACSKAFSPQTDNTTIFTFAGENFDLGYGNTNGFILKYDANGNEIWADRLLSNDFDSGYGFDNITSDGVNVYTSSSLVNGYVSFGGKAGGGPSSSVTNWFAKIQPNKTTEWLTEILPSSQYAGFAINDIAVSGRKLLMTGSGSSLQFGPDILLNDINFNGLCIASLNSDDNTCKPSQPASFTQSSSNLCKGQTNVAFTVPSVANVTYKWVYRGTGLTLNTATGNTITLNVEANATSDTLYCIPSNTCGVGPVRKIFININQNTPNAKISAASDVNFILNGGVKLKVDFTGTAPYSVHLSDGSSYTSPTNSLIIDKTGITNNTLFTITSLTDAVCPSGLSSSEVFVTMPRCLDKALTLLDGGSQHPFNGYINGDQVASNGISGVLSEMTVEMWIHPFDVQNCLFFRFDNLFFQLNNGFLQIGNTQLSNVPIEKNKWTHIAVSTIPNSNKIKVYKNGVFVTQIVSPTYNFDGAVFGFDHYDGSHPFFKGLIDEFRIFNYSYSASEIRNFMIGNTADYETDLMVYYNFNRTGTGAGLTVTNVANNGASGNATTSGNTVTFSAICPVPAQPATFTQSKASVCNGENSIVYAIPNVNGVSYKWTYSGTGITIIENRNTATIDYGINATAGILSVVASNPSGVSTARTMAISIDNCTKLYCLGNDITFNGTEYIEIPSAPIRPTTAITYELWLKSANTNGQSVTPLNNGQYINNAVGSGAYIQIQNTTYAFTIFTEDGGFGVGGTMATFDNWEHIACTYDSNTGQVKFYKNGFLVSSGTASGLIRWDNNTTIKFRIGQFNDSFGQNYTGQIDEVRVWNTARTQAQIQANMNHELIGNETGLLAYYTMNRTGQGAGLTVINNATITNTSADGITFGSVTQPVFVNNENSILNLVNNVPISGALTGTQFIQAGQIITAPPIGQTNIISNTANVSYKAGNAIILNKGFQTQAGAVFKAQIGSGCNN